MSAVSDSEILSRLEKLSISNTGVIQHAPVKGGAEWKEELGKLGKGDVALTKTVSGGELSCSVLPYLTNHFHESVTSIFEW